MYSRIDNYIIRLIEGSTPYKPLWNIENILYGKPAKWNYIDGCMLTALLSISEIKGDSRHRDFAEQFISHYVDEDGAILGYSADAYNLDDVNEGRVLFDLCKITGKEKYKKAIFLLHDQLERQPRSEKGSFWHKLIYPDQVWLDGIYMAQVFCVRFQQEFGDGDISDTMAQIRSVRKYMFDEEKKLYCHGYDCSKKAFWADPETGRSKSFWLRAIGWYAVALTDIIGYLEPGSDRDELAALLRETVEGISQYADPQTGLYYQVVDQGGREGNYLETSGSSMIAYAMMKGARLGVLDASYAESGKKTFDGICGKYLSVSNSGKLRLSGICLMAGLGPENNRRRDGSYEYYISEPVVDNDAKGVAPFLLCYTELMRSQQRAHR